MSHAKVENVVGALALALADDILKAAQRHSPKSSSAAAIALVGHAPGITIGQLGRTLGLSHPGAVRLVDRLEGNDFLKRDRSRTDGRAIALTLTHTGAEVCQRILSSRQSALARALSSLDSADRNTFGRIAETMLRNMLTGEDHAFEVCRLCDPAICDECPVETEIMSRESQT